MRMATGSFLSGPLVYGLCCGRKGMSGGIGRSVEKETRGLLL